MRLVPLGIIATILIVAIASIDDSWAFWGFNHLFYFPPAIRVLLIAACIASCIQPIRRNLGSVCTRTVSRLVSPEKNSLATAAVTSLIFVGLCLLFRSSTRLWGDSELMASIAEKASGAGYSIIGGASYAVHRNPLAPGVAAIHSLVARAGTLAGLDARWALSSFYAVLGGFWLLMVIRQLRLVKVDDTIRVLLGILLITSGSVMLFFGYIEDYGLVFFGATILALYGLSDPTGPKSRVLTVVLALALVLLHLLSVLLLPAATYLLLSRGTVEHKRLVGTAILVAAVTCVAAVTAYFVDGLSVHYRPLANYYRAVLSAHYVSSLLNLLAILVPAFLILVTAVIAGRRSDFSMDLRTKLFCFVGVVPFVIFLVFFKPDLGMARDWDMYALASPFLIIAALPFLGERAFIRDWIAPIAVVSLVQTATWVGVNAKEAWSAARYEDSLENDPSHVGYGYEVYAQYLEHKGQDKAAYQAWRHAFEMEKNPRYAINLGKYAARFGHPDEAVALMNRVLRVDSTNSEARVTLGSILAQTGRFDALIDVAREGLRYEPDNPYYNFFLGMSLLETRQYQQALEQLTKCESLALPPGMRKDVDKALTVLRQNQKGP